MQQEHVATHCGGRGHRDYRGEAFSHNQSDKAPPTMSLKVSLITASKSEVALETWLGGQERRTKATFGSVRHERSSVVSNWESLMPRKASREAFTSAILLLKTASQKTGGPMGQPRRALGG